MRARMAPLCLTVAALAACSAENEVDGRSEVEQAIIGGRGSEADVAVGALLNGRHQSCSCTLIAPTVALTAAHCLPPHTPVAVADMRVFFGQNTEFEGDEIRVLDATPHPLWSPNFVGYDIGLIRLERPVLTPAATLSAAPLGVQQIGTAARIVGYGIHTEGGSIHEFRRSGSAIVDSITPFSIRLAPDDAISCIGDSGGPTLLERDGVEFVAAVHSRSDCETRSIEERVDIHMATFIEPYLEAARQCGLNFSCNLPCTRAAACEIECDRADECRPPPVEPAEGCAVIVGGRPRAGAVLVLMLVAVLTGRLTRQPKRDKDLE